MKKGRKKILIVVDSIDVNDSSGSKANVALISSIAKAEFEVKALHYTRKKITLSGVNCKDIIEKKWNLYFLLSRLERIFTRYTKINLNPFFERWFGFSFTFLNDVNSFVASIKKEKVEDFDYVLTLSKGTSFRPHAALLKLPNWHSKWLAYVHDPYPQHLYPRPYNFIENGYRKKRNFFRDVTINAHKLIFPSLLLKEWMQSYYVHIEGKSIIIPHQLRTISIPNKIRNSFFDKANFNVLHAGNLLDLRDPKPLILAFEKFLKIEPEAKEEAKLLLIGKKSIYTQYLKEQVKKIPQLFVSEGYVNFEEVYVMQQSAEINVILEASSEISPFLPGKFPHCISANKPILLIGPYYSECKRLLGKDYPYAHDFNDIDEIATTMATLYKSWKVNKDANNLNKLDLMHYLSSDYLKEVFEKELL
jgi:hypothetical protein